MSDRREEDAVARAKRVRLMIFDVDGVLTDGALYFSDSGGELKVFHARDGHGLKMLRESGVDVAILTGRRSPAVAARAAELGIDMVEQGVADKGSAFDRLLLDHAIPAGSAGYIGDDLPDLPALTRCGFAASVPDAPQAVRERVHYVTRAGGGRGAAREICEFIMQAQQTFEGVLARQLA